LEAEAAALDLGGADTVATVGVLDVHPRAVNSIPRDVMLEIDVRDIDGPRRDRVVQRIRTKAEEFGAKRETPATVELINADPPTTCDATIVSAIERSAAEANLACQQSRLSRYNVHVADLPCGHDFHTVPKRGQPPSGRIRLA
jgi:acetylornithine deacetylase/succinyl-diaminopimelate desuccinylase-like protein